MRIENLENQSLSWVSISSAGALDMTHCAFSAKTSSEAVSRTSSPGLTRTKTRVCKKRDKDHLEFLCELDEAQVAVATSCTS